MKVVLLVSELEDYALTLANGLARQAEVMLVVPRRRFARLADEVDPAVDLRLVDWPRHRSLRNPAFLLRLTRLLRDAAPDVIHLLGNNVLWLNLAMPAWHRAVIVTTVHDVALHPGDRDSATLPGWAPRLAALQSDHLVVHGAGLRQAAMRRFNRPAGRVHVLPHPAIPRYAALARAAGLARRQPDPGRFTLLMFGRIFAYKGLETLVRAEALLADQLPGLRIVIAGRGDDPRALAGLMGDPRRYHILNRFIEDREVAQLFLDADAVVLPYTEASQSGVLNVAAPFGLPVIASDVGELRATVESGDFGLVVPPGEPARLAGAIGRLFHDRALRRELGENARRWAEGPNAPETVAARGVDLYRRLLAERRARAPEPAGAGVKP